MPIRAKIFLGETLGWLWFDVFRIRRNVAIDNVRRAFPELSPTDHVRLARASLFHMGRTIVEFAEFPFFGAEDVPRFFEFEGSEHIEAARAQDKGVLLLSLHIGNGDFAISALSRKGYPVAIVSKLFKSQWLNDLWFGMRRRHGTGFIAPEKSSFEILRALKRKQMVAFVLDQYMGPPVGCRTRFFGRDTGTAMGLAVIAQRTGAPVVPSYTYRRADGKAVGVFLPAIPWQDVGPDASNDENITAMTQVYTDTIESIIRRHPEQWMWIHRRWKNFA